MTWALALREFVKSLPVIVAMLMELRKLWNEHISTLDRRAKMKELREAIRLAHQEKNTEKIEALLRDIVGSQ